MSSYGEKAEALFGNGYNCAQAVLLAFKDITNLNDEVAAKLASPFGAGMGQLREACGAFTGALLVLGADDGNADPADRKARRRVYSAVQAFADRFRDIHGSVVCGELLGLRSQADGAAPAPRKASCSTLVRTAAELLVETLRLA